MAQKPAKSKGGRPPKIREDLPAIRRAAETRARAHRTAKQAAEAADQRFATVVRETLAITNPTTGRLRYSLADIARSSGLSITHLHRLTTKSP